MIPCPLEGCPGAMTASGFTRKIAPQKCPDCGRFRQLLATDPLSYYCKKCEKLQDIESTIQLYVCDTCKNVQPEDHPDMIDP